MTCWVIIKKLDLTLNQTTMHCNVNANYLIQLAGHKDKLKSMNCLIDYLIEKNYCILNICTLFIKLTHYGTLIVKFNCSSSIIFFLLYLVGSNNNNHV